MNKLVRITYIPFSKVLGGLRGYSRNFSYLIRLVRLLTKTNLFEYISLTFQLLLLLTTGIILLFWVHWIHESLGAWSW